MFEICCMIDDKKLVKYLKALDGLIVGQPKISIVRGAKAKGDKVVSSQPNPGSHIYKQVAAMISDRQLEHVNSNVLRTLIKDAGGNPSTFSSVAMKLQKLKVLGKGRRGKGYAVLTGANSQEH